MSIVQVGGSIERALKGDYKIDVKATLSEAWQLTLKSRVAINFGVVFIILLYILVTFIFSMYVPFIKQLISNPEIILIDPSLVQSNADKIMLWELLLIFIVWPFAAGIEMMGVLHSVGMKTEPKMIFSFLKRSSWVVICVLITSTVTNIGFELLILPGIFLKVTLLLTVPLVIEKQMTPVKAIALSIKALRFRFFSILTLYSILFFFLIAMFFISSFFLSVNLAPVGIVLFIFGITYLAPLYYNVKGILYREIFGVSVATDKSIDELTRTNNTSVTKSNSDPDDTFTA